MPFMSDEQIAQATDAYIRAQYAAQWGRAWGSPMNPLGAVNEEPPVKQEPSRARKTSLEEARPGDKTGAIDVAFVRVR